MLRRRPLEVGGDYNHADDDANSRHSSANGANGGASHQERRSLLHNNNPPATASAAALSHDDDDVDVDVGIVGNDYHDSHSMGTDDVNTTSNSGSSCSVIEILEDDEEATATHGRRLCWSFRVVLVLSALCGAAVVSIVWLVPAADDAATRVAIHTAGHSSSFKDGHILPVDFDCPAGPAAATIDTDDPEYEYAVSSSRITTNVTEFLETFRDENFDSWGRSYETIKEGLLEFKSTYYPPYLRNGSTIYESACGIGLNLYMTLEIMRDVANLTHLIVYGNEYVPESAEKANWVLDEIMPPGGAKGVVCAADSTNLSHVPSNAFDLVYTGYVTPLLDPLTLHPEPDYARYNQICDTLDDAKVPTNSDWMGEKLNEIIQQRQEDWYGTWVGEMARIAKPGGPVIVEQVSPSYCSARRDWGGVDRDYWARHAKANTYRWNVDPASIEIVKDKIFKARYNVFMLKKLA
jgi:hypothetical protein